jgi:hypothetical protein
MYRVAFLFGATCENDANVSAAWICTLKADSQSPDHCVPFGDLPEDPHFRLCDNSDYDKGITYNFTADNGTGDSGIISIRCAKDYPFGYVGIDPSETYVKDNVAYVPAFSRDVWPGYLPTPEPLTADCHLSHNQSGWKLKTST